MSATDYLAKHYDQLDGAERFVAVLEAMARGDDAEERRLDDGCPRVRCEVDEPAYRTRMSISFTCAALVCASVQRDLDVLRTIETFADVARIFRGFAAERAEDAFWDGWYARAAADGGGDGDAGGEEGAGTEAEDDGEGCGSDEESLALAAGPQVATLRHRAEQPVAIMLGAVRRSVGRTKAVSLLSAWEGFGRFTRECCGVEPLVLTRAWRLLMEDPVPEVRKMHPKAEVDEEQAANWHGSLAGPWAKHAGIY